MVLAQLMESAQLFVTENLTMVVGGIVAVVALSVLMVMGRRRRRMDIAQLVGAGAGGNPAQPTNRDEALSWAPPEQSYADRRGATRREGAPVRVLLSSPSFRNGVNDGFVVDRSTGGLRIAMQSSMAPGSTMQVRAANAPDTVAFVTVIVRNCKKSGDFFEIGCEFEKTPPWNVLLLFG
jgi:hypothetical protein